MAGTTSDIYDIYKAQV